MRGLIDHGIASHHLTHEPYSYQGVKAYDSDASGFKVLREFIKKAT